MALASLVFGILGWSLLPGLGSVAAIFLGQSARARIDASNGHLGGRRLAVAGIALGYAFGISAATLMVAMALGVIFYVGSATHPDIEVDVVRRALEAMPEGASVESRVITMLAEQLGFEEDEIQPKSDLDSLGLDDEDCLELVEHLREEFAVVIDDDEIDRTSTVADLIALIARRQVESTPASKPVVVPPR